jgi:2-C-methyl-D-erythritol 4-phosphate cytidylyltransferase
LRKANHNQKFNEVNQIAIIVAGGYGKRMDSDIPKQFLLLNGDPVLMRSIRAFHNYNPDISLIVALPGEQIAYWQTLCKKNDFDIPHQIIPGGETRHHTVKNATAKIRPGSLVAIHDGVRPLVSNALILTCFDTAAALGNAIPVIELSESIREIEGEKNMAVERSRFRLVQTPQVFQSHQIIEAFRESRKTEFTDEASLVESVGHRINLVRGQAGNIKITTGLDMCIASALLDNCQPFL